MGQHVRGKLGPAGRIELVRLMREDGLSEEGGGRLPLRGALDGTPLVGARAPSQPAGAGVGQLGAGRLASSASLAAQDARRRGAAGVRGA
jgi:hypothetical protein